MWIAPKGQEVNTITIKIFTSVSNRTIYLRIQTFDFSDLTGSVRNTSS